MEISEENMMSLSNYLQQTLSVDINVRRPAEKFLESVEGNQNYPLLLLHVVDKQTVDMTIRIAGAVAFKNYIKRNWKVEEDGRGDRIHAMDRKAIKGLIINLMLHSPGPIQKQLSDAVSIIGRHDFPDKWPNLLTEMIDKFNSGDFHIINGVLHTAHSLFKRYRHEFKSQELWTEIKFVLDKFAKPLTELFVATNQLTATHATNREALEIIYNSLLVISKIFYSLNFQDLPEFFEDNMSVWMPHFHALLITDIPLLHADDDSDPGVMELLKSQICSNIELYAQKYDEEFQSYLPDFVKAVWNLLVTTGQQPKYDTLVSNALQFLATVANRSQYQHLFQDENVLSSICEKVVIPNMEFRVSDEELFEDNAEEYIRRDIEGSDVDTRRRAACDLVKVLSKYFEEKIMSIFGAYVQTMLAAYDQNQANWKSKDVALYLVTSLASKGQTQKHGVTQSSQLVNLEEFAGKHILPELAKDDVNGPSPVLKADVIKYIMIFRSVLRTDVVISTMPQLIKYLKSDSIVVHTYAACTIEKILLMKAPNGGAPIISSETLAPIANDLISGLMSVLDKQGSEENEYVMKGIMRSLSALQEAAIPYLADLVPKLTHKLKAVAKNPSKPHFNHYLFETLVLSIRIVCKQNPGAVQMFEAALFPIFHEMLVQDVQEFMPYVFQILSLLLELHERGQISEMYVELYPFLLSPILWERTGNIHPLVRLLRAFIMKCEPTQMESMLKIQGLLGVFQKLIASKANDHEGFLLMQSLIEFCPNELLNPFMKQVFILLFQRLSSSKTTKYVKGLITFFCFYAINYGANSLIQMIDGIQPQMFGMVLEKVVLTDVQKVSGPVERKIAAVGITKLLCEAPAMLEQPYAQFWCPLLKSIISIFELPQDDTTQPEDNFADMEDLQGYEVAYSQLSFASKTTYDPLQGIGDARCHLAQSLSQLCATAPGKIPSVLSSGLSEVEMQHLQQYLTAANVQLS
ncbi:unnamed protein product [Bemisia tabaci]|uniref:Exportin-2 n=1 Tax=Bemisia tabaci TaxID=7038 RepID=A0A9P0F483_BEMTA|nr:unnamed protein product [Bemisia tabaci]